MTGEATLPPAPPSPDGQGDLRVDVHTGALTFVVASRQERPNLPELGCPFCPGGLEAPEAYEVRWFRNRWPAMPNGRCEVVLYTPEHDATFWSLGVAGARKVIDLWAERSAALGARDDIDYVLVFENRGSEVGATITHPHGQIYAFDFVPDAPTFPYALVLCPDDDVADLPSLDAAGREGLAELLVDVLARLDRLFDAQTPYMLWIHQRPFDGGDWPNAKLHVEIVSPWRAAGVPRYVAAGELGSGVYFNPVAPEDAARALREV